MRVAYVPETSPAPLPLTRRILGLARGVSTYNLAELAFQRIGSLRPRSAFVEAWVVTRLAVLVVLLFLGFRLTYHFSSIPTLWAVLLGFAALYALLEVVTTRLQLLDRGSNIPIDDASRSLLLGLVNITEVLVIFAILYQTSFYLYTDPPLTGSGISSNAGGQAFLRPFDALYFSFITLTTLGYGDIHPVASWYRLLAICEVMIGWPLAVTVLGLLLQNFLAPSPDPRQAFGEGTELYRRFQEGRHSFLRHEEERLTGVERRGCRILLAWTVLWLVLAVAAVIGEVVYFEPRMGMVRTPPAAPARGLAQPGGGSGAAPAKSNNMDINKISFLIDYDNLLENLQRVFTILAIIVGGLWAYFRFFKGRTYKPRLEPTISGTVTCKNSMSYLVTTVRIKNVGLSDQKIHQAGTSMKIYIFSSSMIPAADGSNPGAELPEWDHVATLPILKHHRWVEPGETVEEQELVLVSGCDHSAFRLVLTLVAGGNYWEVPRIVTWAAKGEAHPVSDGQDRPANAGGE
jgi:hypothetical protein